MKLRRFVFIITTLLAASLWAHGQSNVVPLSATNSPSLAPLPLKLPFPSLKDNWGGIPTGPDIEPLTNSRPDFLAPAGVVNVAFGKRVTASSPPFGGSLALVTDGEKQPYDHLVAEFRRGVQWVQIDLGTTFEIYAVVFWLDHRWPSVYRGVVVAVADDVNFIKDVRVLFNNDKENLVGLGTGTVMRYVESRLGKLVDAKGTKARYVRVYANGSNLSKINCFTEIEVWALPSK
jgi:hypothetical protein